MVTIKYALLATEGPHDQAALGRMLQFLGLKKFGGQSNKLDPFWQKFIPQYPKKGSLYARMDMPSIYTSEAHSVAIYQGGGSDLIQNLKDTMEHEPYYKDIHALGVIVDTDNRDPALIANTYYDNLRNFFPDFPNAPGIISEGPPRTGIYALPNNADQGVLDTILISCASVMYPDHKNGAEGFITLLPDNHKNHWKPFDQQKAIIATITSILKPGSTNTASIAQDDWICNESIEKVNDLSLFLQFVNNLLGVSG